MNESAQGQAPGVTSAARGALLALLAGAALGHADVAAAENGGNGGASAPQRDLRAVEALSQANPSPPQSMQATIGNGEAEPAPSGPAPLYGPPAPRVEKGNLADVNWSSAPDIIPPALDEAVNIVTRKYPSALAARAGLRAASSDVKAAKWLRFPSVTGNLSYLDSNSSPQPQLIVETPVWSGGRIAASIRRARAAESVASAQYVEMVLGLALNTSAAYYEIARLTQTEQLLAESIDVHNQLVATMQRRVKQEVSPVADLELARSRAAQIEQQYNVTRAQRGTALRILAELVADPAFDLGPVPYYDPEMDLVQRDALEDQAVAFSPTIRRLSAQAEEARELVDVAKASILPQINAQYSYDNLFGNRVGVVVRAQNQGGLSQFSQVNAAKLRTMEAQEGVRTAEQQLRRDMASDIIIYDAAKKRAIISRDATDTAARVSASYMRQFIAGRRSWLDVMNALREAVTAQIGRVDSEVNVMSSAARLLLRSGRWHPEFEESTEPPQEAGERPHAGDRVLKTGRNR